MTGRSSNGVAAVGLILFGAALRLLEYAGNRPLWADEAMLSLNVARRSFRGLLQPLDYDQAAAPLFLWIAKAGTLIGGVTEASLRAASLLAGILVLVAGWRFARRLAGEPTALLATALAAGSLTLIYYSGEFKPYAIDALVTLLVFQLAWAVLLEPDSAPAWRRLAFGGALATAVSLTAPFVLLGAGAALLADRRIRTPGLRWRAAATGVSWLVAWGALYLLLYRATAGNPYLHRFWAATYLDPSAADFRLRLYRAGSSLAAALPEPLDGMPPIVLLLLFAAGAWTLFRTAGLPAVLLAVVPFAATFGAAAASRYPIVDRLLIFLAPVTFLLVAAALTAPLRRLAPRGAELAGFALAALVIGAALPGLRANLTAPTVLEEGRESIREVQRLAGAEPVYIFAPGLPAWVFYTTDWRDPDRARLDRLARLASAGGAAAHNAPSRGGPVPAEEGQELVGTYRGRREILGIRSGMEYQARRGRLLAEPDSGWADHEVARLRAAATPYGWVFVSHWNEEEIAHLAAALRRAAARTVFSVTETRAVAWRVRFDTVPP